MATYMIFMREGAIVDAEAMLAYQAGNRSGPAPQGMTPLVVYGAMECLEGDPVDGIVMLRFENTEDAKAWYHSPEYQERMKLRQKAAPYRCIMVEGL
ncbi:MAG: DUF1330 domain-containing protein [Novosphingobium sp.]